MATLTEYISDLNDLNVNLEQIIRDAINAKKGFILGLIKNRLYQTGVSGDGSLIGYYADSTIEEKKSKGRRSSFITLRDEGDFYKGMFVEFNGSELIASSTDGKTSSLIQEYGASILEWTEYEQELIINTIIEPAIINHINNLAEIISLGSVSENLFSAN